MVKMVDMSRDTDQLGEMIHNGYNPEYPVSFFLDPVMVKELGIEDVAPGEEIKIVGTIRINSVTKDDEKTEMHAAFTTMAAQGKADASATDKMSESYKGGKDGAGQT